MPKKDLKKIQSLVEDLLAELGVAASFSVTTDKDSPLINIQIETEQPALLIGFHGETLSAVERILSFMIHRVLGRWHKVVVNVGDYRQKREEQIKRLALNLAMKAKFSKETQSIPNLSASERRIVHLVLADHPDVYTESEGEGKERYLTIKLKTG